MNKLSMAELHNVVALAWADDCSFDTIYAQLGLSEKDVIKIMRGYLKRRSFELWRARVTGRKTKHHKKYFVNAERIKSPFIVVDKENDDD